LTFQFFFERVFLTQALKLLFVSADDSVLDWRFRWQLDRYVCSATALFLRNLIPTLKVACTIVHVYPFLGDATDQQVTNSVLTHCGRMAMLWSYGGYRRLLPTVGGWYHPWVQWPKTGRGSTAVPRRGDYGGSNPSPPL